MGGESDVGLHPGPIPIEQVSLLEEWMNADSLNAAKVAWKVCGCRYTWVVETEMRDLRDLCRMLMLEKYPVSRVDQTIAEQDDVVMVGEVEGLLSNYRALLVTLPVERVFKQNYHSFKRLE